MHGRGKKLNTDKNARSAEDFAKGKRVGRPKPAQRWIWDVAPKEGLDPKLVRGHWEKVNAL
jgi:hypothetical protein